ncbi:MAG: signal peptidase I, partial [Gammaproteobacteria bacterium]|nr:signal peptidase I [Gammaproteobacteria bacterium]
MDFSLVLAIVILVAGSIWAIDAWFFAPKRDKNEFVDDENKNLTNEPAVVEFARFIFPVVLIVFILRGFIAEPFRIPSGSMLPTLEVGDFILVSKFNYGVRLPVINKKIIDLGSPEKGDVVV